MTKYHLLLTSVLAMSIPTVAIAQSSPEDLAAQAYMNTFPNASVEEAKEIMSGERQQEVSDVYNCVKDLDGFAGLETRHIPVYRVVVKFTKQSEKKLRSCTSSKKVFQSVGAARSLSELEDVLSVVQSELGNADIGNTPFIDLSKNRVIIRVTPDDLKNAKSVLKKAKFGENGIGLGRSIRFETVQSLADIVAVTRGANTDIETRRLNRSGTLDDQICTSGFNVKFFDSASGTFKTGGTTSNHCGRQVRYERDNTAVQTSFGTDANLCWRGTTGADSLQERADLQWFAHPDDDYEGIINNFPEIPNFITRDVKGTLNSGSASSGGGWIPLPGTMVCMSGRTTRSLSGGSVDIDEAQKDVIDPRTGKICSFPARDFDYKLDPIGSTNIETCGVFQLYEPLKNRAIAVIPGSTNARAFTQGGDSGGPVYTFGFNNAGEYGVLAMGSVRGHRLGDIGELSYTPIESFTALGLTVISKENP